MSLLSNISGGVIPAPPHVGEKYNEELNTGSFVDGLGDIAKKELNKLRFMAEKYLRFDKDPSKAAWLLEWATRADPVKLPKEISNEDFNILKYFWTKYTKDLMGVKTVGNVVKNLTDKATEADYQHLLGKIAEPYRIVSPYDGQIGKMITSVQEAVDVMSLDKGVKGGINIGYRQWYGFEPGSDHNWDVQIYPYNGPDKDDLDEEPNKSYTLTPKLPSYELPKICANLIDTERLNRHYRSALLGENNQINPIGFSFGKNCPCVGYQIQYGNQNSKQVSLFNGGSFDMPLGFQYNMQLSLDILDDVAGSMRKYMNKYINATYDQEHAAVARYDQSAFLIRIIILENRMIPKFEFRFIAVPINYSPTFDGDDGASIKSIHIDFSVIGMKVPKTDHFMVSSVGTKEIWTDVNIAPNNYPINPSTPSASILG